MKHVSIKQIALDLSDTIYIRKEIKRLHSIAQKVPKEFSELYKKKLRELRAELQQYAGMMYEIHVVTKDKTHVYEYFEWPTASNIKDCLDLVYGEIRKKRRESRQVKSEDKSFYGFTYKTTGGVFTVPKSILPIRSSTPPEERIRKAKAPMTKDRNNFVGVELELVCSVDRAELSRLFIQAKLEGNVQIKSDSSIRSERDQYPHEVTVMFRQHDAKYILGRVLTVLSTVNAKVNESCGTHVHFDMRNRDVSLAYSRLFALQPLLRRMVAQDRITNTYCKPNTMSKFTDAQSRHDKYHVINPNTYNNYKTLEVRLHNGTLSLVKLVNWIGLITYVIDNAPTSSKLIVSPQDLLECYPNITPKMYNYVTKRVEDHDKGFTTTEDFVKPELNQYEMAV